MTSSIGNREKTSVQCLDKGLMVLPFAFVINGVANPLVANNLGDVLQGVQVTRASAGKFTFAPKGTAITVVGGYVGPMPVADNVDLTGQVGGATDMTTPSVVVRTMTGAVATDPPNGMVVSGFLLVKITKLRASQ